MDEQDVKSEQSPAAPDQPAPDPGTDADPLAQSSGVEEARSCVGSKLDELGGASMGRIDSVLADALDGSPTWLVVRLGRFGRRAAVPFDFVAPAVGHVWAPFAREVIRSAAELDPAGGLSVADERELAAHYGVQEGAGRLAALADRPPEDPASIPA